MIDILQHSTFDVPPVLLLEDRNEIQRWMKTDENVPKFILVRL